MLSHTTLPSVHVIMLYSRRRRWSSSRRCSKDLEPDGITYNAAISACDNAIQSQKALELIQEMQQKDLEPDVHTYSAAISACEKALELLEEMRRKGLEPNVVTYYAANCACDKVVQSQKLLELIQEMQAACCA